MARIYTNTANHTALDGSLTSGATTIALLSTTGWPVPGAGETALACIDYDSATGSVREVVSYSGVSGSSLTGVTRGVDGTSGQAHSDGASVVHVASAADISGSTGTLEFELSSTFTMADHLTVTAYAGTFTPTATTAMVTVGISGLMFGAAHIGAYFIWNDTVTAGDPLLTGDDFQSDPFVTGTEMKTIGPLSGPGNTGDAMRRLLLTGLTPGTETTFEVVVAAVGYFDSYTTGDFPVDLAIDAAHERLYVTDFTSNKVEVFKTIWRSSSDRQLEKITEFASHTGAYGVATHPTTATRVFVARFGADQVVEINGLTGTVVSTWSVTDPYFLVADPNGTRLWVVRQGTNQVQPITLGGTVGTAITVGAGPYKPVCNATHMFIPCATANAIYRINLSTLAVDNLALGASTAPVALDVSPDGTTLWVLEQTAQRAREVDLSTFTLTGESITSLGASTSDIQISPSGKSLVIVRGALTTSMQTYVLPPAGVMYESADVQEISRMILGHDGSIYALANGDDLMYVWHAANLEIDPTDNFWGGYLSVLIER